MYHVCNTNPVLPCWKIFYCNKELWQTSCQPLLCTRPYNQMQSSLAFIPDCSLSEISPQSWAPDTFISALSLSLSLSLCLCLSVSLSLCLSLSVSLSLSLSGETTPDTYSAIPSGYHHDHCSLCSIEAWNRGSVNCMPLFPAEGFLGGASPSQCWVSLWQQGPVGPLALYLHAMFWGIFQYPQKSTASFLVAC